MPLEYPLSRDYNGWPLGVRVDSISPRRFSTQYGRIGLTYFGAHMYKENVRKDQFSRFYLGFISKLDATFKTGVSRWVHEWKWPSSFDKDPNALILYCQYLVTKDVETALEDYVIRSPRGVSLTTKAFNNQTTGQQIYESIRDYIVRNRLRPKNFLSVQHNADIVHLDRLSRAQMDGLANTYRQEFGSFWIRSFAVKTTPRPVRAENGMILGFDFNITIEAEFLRYFKIGIFLEVAQPQPVSLLAASRFKFVDHLHQRALKTREPQEKYFTVEDLGIPRECIQGIKEAYYDLRVKHECMRRFKRTRYYRRMGTMALKKYF